MGPYRAGGSGQYQTRKRAYTKRAAVVGGAGAAGVAFAKRRKLLTATVSALSSRRGRNLRAGVIKIGRRASTIARGVRAALRFR